MNWKLVKLLFCISILHPITSASIADWIWGSEDESQESSLKRQVNNDVVLPEVPFESTSSDDKFLQEAQDLGLAPSSNLDTCQQKVVLHLRASCASLTEEQLSKLSVALLNCQSAAEGRQQYPCTDEMSLRECTGDMDPDTWNTYHLMNNRARAVCLAARQAQFRILTEMTVNRLMNSAQGQLDAMHTLKDGQEKLSSLTEGTLRSVTDGHRSLLKQQETLRAAQRNAHNFVAHSLRELSREKSLVAAGHRELARISQGIRQKLDLAGEEMFTQSEERREQHKQLIEDLQKLQAQAAQIWTDIDKNTQEILSRHEMALHHYEQTLDGLRTINSTVLYLQNLLENTRKEVDQRLGWISDTLGGAGGQLDLVIACLMHLGFLLMAMLTTAFLSAPACTRILLLLLVSLNIMQLLRQGPEAPLSLPATCLLLAVGTGIHQLIHALHRMLSTSQATASLPAPPRPNGTASPVREGNEVPPPISRVRKSVEELWDKTMNFLGFKVQAADNPTSMAPAAADTAQESEESSDEFDSGVEDPASRFQFSSYPRLRRVTEASREATPPTAPPSRSGTPVRASTPRQQCSAICINGQPCRIAATVSGLCYRHARQNSRTPQ